MINYVIEIFFYDFRFKNALLCMCYKLVNLRFSDVFRGYRSGTLVENGLSQKFSFVPQNLILTKYLISVATALIYESNDVQLFRNQI